MTQPAATSSPTTPGNPADTTGNSPADAQPSAVAANTSEVAPAQNKQADVEINQDPLVGTVQPPAAEEAEEDDGDDYDDENVWPYRRLQSEAKDREINAAGTRDEIVARLREADANGPAQSDGTSEPKAAEEVQGSNATASVNGGIALNSERSQLHAETLQSLSDERREQQLAAVRTQAEGQGSQDD
ncbi:hypothetical protein [Longimicrobium sp.]|jgi:hypothetical protein|uniref:hypothetical protein n=1 Tax=Longimicrobium sp. TaxID=2029185 RepID=UPI002ED8DD31